MKKFAYLIIAHENFRQLKFLISLLDSEDTDIYLLIDKKASVSLKVIEMLENTLKKSSLFRIPSIDIRWGGIVRSALKCDCLKRLQRETISIII